MSGSTTTAREVRHAAVARPIVRGITFGEVAHVHRFEHASDARANLVARDFAYAEAVRHVLEDRHVRPDRVALKDQRHVAIFRWDDARRTREQPLIRTNLAFVRTQEAGDQAKAWSSFRIPRARATP